MTEFFLKLRRIFRGSVEPPSFSTEGLSGIDPKLSLDDSEYVVIDTELTGLDQRKDAIVAFGALKMSGGRIDVAKTFYSLVRPDPALAVKNVTIHGLTPTELAETPEIDDVMPDIIEFCGKDIIVGYLPLIDMIFINRELKRIRGATLDNPVIDVFSAHKWLRQRMGESLQKNPTLYEIAAGLGIAAKGAHNALSDAYITAQVFQQLLPQLKNLGIVVLEDLLSISTISSKIDRFRYSSKISNL